MTPYDDDTKFIECKVWWLSLIIAVMNTFEALAVSFYNNTIQVKRRTSACMRFSIETTVISVLGSCNAVCCDETLKITVHFSLSP